MTGLARTAEEVCQEGKRLERFRQAWAVLDELLPTSSPLGQEAAGALAFIDWIFGKGPALSDCLEDALRYTVKEIGYPRRGDATGPVGRHSAAGGE